MNAGPFLRRPDPTTARALTLALALALALMHLPLRPSAHAAKIEAPLLPYTVRKHSYFGFSSALRGDLRYVGMAGATTGLADTPIGASENPAGPAMTVRNLDAIITENVIYNENLQGGSTTPLYSTQAGITGPAYPWGIALSIRSSHGEGGRYRLPGGDAIVNPELTVREMQLSASRTLLNDRLSLGVGAILGSSQLTLAPESAATGAETLLSSSGATALGLRFGAMVQLPGRWFLGASGAAPMEFRIDPGANLTSDAFGITNFHRNVLVPWRGSAGVGWIPNRYFRAGAALRFSGPAPDAALLSDDSLRTGTGWTFQPSIGANYFFYDRPGLNAEASLGTYLESTGIQGQGAKPHFTIALLASPGIFFFGAGLDAATGYSNASVAFGIDLIRTLAWQKIVPPNPPPLHYGGTLPSPLDRSDDGLPRPIVATWRPQPGLDYLDVGLNAPERLEERLKETGRSLLLDPGKSLLDMGKGLRESVGGLVEIVPIQEISEPEKKKGTGRK